MQSKRTSIIYIIVCILFCNFNATAQLELYFAEDELESFEFVPDSYQNIRLIVKNTADTAFYFNWEYIYSDSLEVFFSPYIADLNISYYPGFSSNCDIDNPNILEPQATGELLIAINFQNIQPTVEEIENLSFVLNLLSYPDCEVINTSIAIPFTADITGNENIVSSNFMIYPNPSRNVISLQHAFAEDEFPHNSQYTIFDSNGKSIKRERLNSNEISIEHLLEGVYILSIESQNKTWHSKFVKL